MKLLRLRLENFRQHQLTDIEFSDGMTAIVGENGSGKSTLLEAISFALYGDCRGKMDTICFNWSESRKYRVNLQFEFDGHTFEVDRTTNDAFLKQLDAGRVWASGKTSSAAACEKLLGLNYEHFINSFCAEQKNLKFLQFQNAPERQTEVARMLGYDKLRDAEALATERRKTFSTRSQTIQGLLGDLPEMESARDKAQERLAAERLKSEECSVRIQQAELELPKRSLEAELAGKWLSASEKMAEIRGQVEGLKPRREEAAKTVESTAKELAEKQSLEASAKEFGEVEEAWSEMQKGQEIEIRKAQMHKEADSRLAEIESLSKQIEALPVADVDGLLRQVRESIEAHGKAAEKLASAREAWQAAIRAADKALATASANATNAGKDLSHATQMAEKGLCPECGQPITAGYQEIVEKRKAIKREADLELERTTNLQQESSKLPQAVIEAEAEEAEARKSNTRRQSEYEAAKAAADQARILREQHDIFTKARENLLSEITGLKSNFDAEKRAALETRRNELAPIHRRYLQIERADERHRNALSALKKAETEFTEARDLYRTLEADRKQFPFENTAEARSAQDRLKDLESRLAISRNDLKASRELELAAKREVEQAAGRIAEHKKRRKELSEIQRLENLHDIAAREMRSLRIALNNEIGPQLEARASENLHLLTNGRYLKLVLDKNFQPSVVEDDETVKPIISGGEEDVVALALRLSLSELIQERQGRPMSLLILDEVFGSLDVDRRQAVLERLAALKPRFQQILVISHIEDINQVADRCLYVRRSGSTRASVVTDSQPMVLELT